MKAEGAGPGVQNGGDGELGRLAEPPRVAGERVKGGRGALEEQVVQAHAILSDQLVELARDGEDDVEKVRGDQAAHAVVNPAGLAQRLALGAMAVATGIRPAA